jgi:hypothetical protein
MTRYRLSPPDGRHEDDPPIIAESGEISDGVAEWLMAIGIARPFSEAEELADRLAEAFVGLAPRAIAAAILDICPEAASQLADRARVLRAVMADELGDGT